MHAPLDCHGYEDFSSNSVSFHSCTWDSSLAIAFCDFLDKPTYLLLWTDTSPLCACAWQHPGVMIIIANNGKSFLARLLILYFFSINVFVQMDQGKTLPIITISYFTSQSGIFKSWKRVKYSVRVKWLTISTMSIVYLHLLKNELSMYHHH